VYSAATLLPRLAPVSFRALEPVSKVLQLLCVMSELASIQSFYHTGSLKMLLLLPVQDWQVSGYT